MGEISKISVSPVMKLMEMVGGAIGTVYEPRHKRKMADATAYEISVIGNAIRNAADMPIVYDKNGVALNSEDFSRLMQRAGTRLTLQETIRQHNIECVVDNAYEILEKEENCSDEPVEQGWINRFFNSVADVSDKDLQKLWGKILAGEIKQPNSYSLRTLETLKNLSEYEAKLFERTSSFVLKMQYGLFLTSNTEILKKYGVSYENILCLDECGLINSDGMVMYNPKISVDAPAVVYAKSKLLLLAGFKETMTKISFGIFGLTQVGKELYSLLDFDINQGYLCDFAEEIEKNNRGIVSVTLHKIYEFDNENIMYDKVPLRRFPPKRTK